MRPALDPDPLSTGKVLAAAIKPLEPDVVLCGKYSVGEDNSQVPAILAEFLDLPQVTGATKIDWMEGKIRAHREIEGGEEIVESQLPAVLSTHKGINEPRYASLKGIMAAKKKEIQEVTPESLGLGAGVAGSEGRKLVVKKISLPPPRGGGKVLSGEPAEVARQLVDLLHNEAKVI